MNKSESKYFNTAHLMDEALMNLLERKSYDYITVKEICEKAGVNRSTFYLHYETMEDLLCETIEFIGNKVRDKFSKEIVFDKEYIQNCPIEELKLITPQYLLPYLEFVKENRKVFIAAASQPVVLKTKDIFQVLQKGIFEPILARFCVPEKEGQYRLTFGLNGMYAVMMQWIAADCADDIDYIAALLIKFLNP